LTPMRNLMLAIAALIGFLISGSVLGNAQSAAQKEPPPDVPDAIQVPAGLDVVVYAHATGSQIYTCQARRMANSLGRLRRRMQNFTTGKTK